MYFLQIPYGEIEITQNILCYMAGAMVVLPKDIGITELQAELATHLIFFCNNIAHIST